MTDDTMTADEAHTLLVSHELTGNGRTLAARALRSVIALHEAAAAKERHAAFYFRQAWALGVDAGRRSAAVALREVLPDAWERLRDAPEPEWPTAGVHPEAPDDAAFRAAWRAGAAAGREEAAEVCDRVALFHHPTMRAVIAAALADRIRALPPASPASPLASPSEAPQCPEAPPDGGTEPGGGGEPARGLPVAPLWERVRVVAREEALPRPRLASLFVASVALGTLGLPEPHIEVIRGEVVLTWQSDDVTATAAVRASGVWTRFWCDDGGPVRSGVEMRTLDLAAPGAIPAWWIAVARRCPVEGPSGRSAAEGETAPEGDGGR